MPKFASTPNIGSTQRAPPKIAKKAARRVPTTGNSPRRALPFSDREGERAAAYLVAADKRFVPHVATNGALSLSGVKDEPSSFAFLVKAITSQQLASKAAAAIHARLLAAVESEPPTPAAVLATPLIELRKCGLSDRKASYIIDLATHFDDGRLSEELLQTASDQEVVEKLTAVKGIGPMSCEAFLMFQLCRPDVLPSGNLTIRKKFADFFGLGDKVPAPDEMERLSHAWSPYRSYACYYLWLSRAANANNHTVCPPGSM